LGREKLRTHVIEKSAPARVARWESSQARFLKNIFVVFVREKLKNNVFEKNAPARVPRWESSLAKCLKNIFFGVFGSEKLKTNVLLRKVHRLESPGRNRAWPGFSKTSLLEFSGAKSSKTTFLRKVHRLESPRRIERGQVSQKRIFLIFRARKTQTQHF
jgi:hypothetical protein